MEGFFEVMLQDGLVQFQKFSEAAIEEECNVLKFSCKFLSGAWIFKVSVLFVFEMEPILLEVPMVTFADALGILHTFLFLCYSCRGKF